MKKTLSLFVLLISISLSGQTNYVNKGFGISATMPAGWLADDYPDTTKDLTLTDQARTKMLNKGPVYLTSYFNGYVAVRRPKIQIEARVKPEKTYEAFKKEAIRSAEKLRNYFENFEYIEKPSEITISGVKGIHFIIKHDMLVMGKKMKVRNHIYGIPYKNYLFMITLTDWESEDSTNEFDSFMKTIKIGL